MMLHYRQTFSYRLYWRKAGLALVFWGGLTTALAGMTITPVGIELSMKKRVGQVVITNTGDVPITIQASSAVWLQVENADRYEEADVLLVVPAIAEIPARGAQVFRVGLRGALPREQERAFRLYLEDVTEPVNGVSVSLRLRHDLPVMVSPDVTGEPMMRLEPCVAPSPPGCVRLSNLGHRRVVVTGLHVQGAAEQPVFKIPVTVLAGAWKQWVIDLPPQFADAVKVTAETKSGSVSAEIPLVPR